MKQNAPQWQTAIEFEDITSEDANELKASIEKHQLYTNSQIAKTLLADWDTTLGNFVKVMPIEYKRALKRLETEEQMVEELTA